MRILTLAALTVVVAACSPAPTPEPMTPVASEAALTPPATSTGPDPVAEPIVFSFDVENQASIGVIVSVASDTAATMPGFEPGQLGTISIKLLNPDNGIGVDIQGNDCHLLANATYPTPAVFTLIIEDGADAGAVKLSTRSGIAATPIPLPSNSLVGCGG